MSFHEYSGITAGILAFSACPIYLSAILAGKTRPDRVTWWILALVSGMIAASYYASGARDTIWLPVGYTASFLVIALFSLKYGEGPFRLHWLDRLSLIGSLTSAAVWWSLRSPVPALFMNICTEFIGLIPTMSKAYRRPWTENPTAWVISTVASVFNVLAIEQWTFIIASYPVYVLLTNTMIAYFIMQKKQMELPFNS